MSVYYDAFQDTTLDIDSQEDFFTIASESDSKILEWLNKNFDSALRSGISRFETYREFRHLYKGIQYKSSETKEFNYRKKTYSREIRNPRIVVNFIQEMLDVKVAKRNETKPAVAFIPNNDSAKDRNGVKACEMLLRNNWMEQDIDKVLRTGDMATLLFGESYTMVEWDKDAGPLHPAFKAAKDKGLTKLKVGNKTINPQKDSIHIGDVRYKVRTPENLFIRHDVNDIEKVDHFTTLDWIHIDKLKHDHPKKDIQEEDELEYENEMYRHKRSEKNVLVKTFYHIPTKYLPEGMMVKYTKTDILEKGAFPYDDGQLPFSRLTDIDIIGELYSRSFIGNIRQLQRHFNNIASGIARNHGIGSAPKWMMPKNSASIESLNNDFTVVEFSGPIAPKLVQSNPTGQEMILYQDKLDGQIQRQSKVGSMSFGEPPKGVDAAVAMQFISEQENKRDNTDIAKKNAHIIKISKLALNRMKQFYKASDNRMIHILGEDNSYLIETFEELNLDSSYDIRIMNSSALPESKGARIQTIISLNQATQTDPSGPIFQTPQIVRMLDLANDEAFKDRASVPEKAAEWVLAKILKGQPVPDPELHDDLITEYKFFMRSLRERTFKDPNIVPSEVKAAIQDRLLVIEGLMWHRSMLNPVFAQKLAMIDTFPCFFKPPQEANVQAMQATMQGQQAEQAMILQEGMTEDIPMEGQEIQQGE